MRAFLEQGCCGWLFPSPRRGEGGERSEPGEGISELQLKLIVPLTPTLSPRRSGLPDLRIESCRTRASPSSVGERGRKSRKRIQAIALLGSATARNRARAARRRGAGGAGRPRGRDDPGRHGRLGLGQPLAGLCRHQEGLLRRGERQGRHRLRASRARRVMQQLAAGSLEHQLSTRPGRSDPRDRQGRADRDRSLRDAGAALRAARQAGDQELKDLKGKIISVGGAEGHHPDLRRAHAGAARRQARRTSTWSSPARPRRRRRRCSRARSTPRSCCRRSISTPRRRASPISGSPSSMADLPFSGGVDQPHWAHGHKDVLQSFLEASIRSDRLALGCRRTAREAVDMMMSVSKLKPRRRRQGAMIFSSPARFFEPTGAISQGEADRR